LAILLYICKTMHTMKKNCRLILPGTVYSLLFLFSIQNSFSQTAPGIQWQNDIGGYDIEYFCGIQQTSDGGYIIGGRSNSDSTGDKTEDCIGDYDYWILKTDPLGNIQWQNTIGGNNVDRLFSIDQTRDGGYILGGMSGSDISGDKTENTWNGYEDYWVVKTDSSGNIQWQNTIGGNYTDFLMCIQQTSDGGYILGGHSNSDATGDKTENCWNFSYDCWIVKIDSAGAIEWQNTIGGDYVDNLYSIIETRDGGYLLGGTSGSGASGDKTENSIGYSDYWIVKTSSTGAFNGRIQLEEAILTICTG
jgi:hypothetical protein